MPKFEIKNRITDSVIYSGKGQTLAEVVEQTVKEGVSLAYANLSYANLSGANLTNANFYKAYLTGSAIENSQFIINNEAKIKYIVTAKTESQIDLKNFPHTCSKCKSPAYIGFNKTECSNMRCK